jgi:hypothetical protein
MYLGHLAAGLAIQSRVREAPLAWLLTATVLTDFVCGVCLWAGLDHAVVHGSLVYGHIASDIGYSHSLVGSIGLAVLAGSVAAGLASSRRIGGAVALAVLSHYVLDVLSHWPDMPLIGFGAAHDIRLGTGLAGHPLAFFLVELIWCLAAWRMFNPNNRRLLITILVLMALYTNTVFGFAPPPVPPTHVFGIVMFVLFGVTTAIVWWAARGSRT